MKLWNRNAAGCAALILAVACSGCGSSKATSTTPAKTAATTTTTAAKTSRGKEQTLGTIAITSPAFRVGGSIDQRYTCDGADLSPPLAWHGVPAHTAELTLLALEITSDNGDAVQWAVAGIPPGVDHLSAGKLPAGAVQGVNSSGKSAWGGLCGAKGQSQRVVFVLYALRKKLRLAAGFNALAVHAELASARLAGGLTLATYTRP